MKSWICQTKNNKYLELNIMLSKKRKITEMMNCETDNRTTKAKPGLFIKTQYESLPCDVCGKEVAHYQHCKNDLIYCSYDCYSILYLSNKDSFLDTDEVSMYSEDDVESMRTDYGSDN